MTIQKNYQQIIGHLLISTFCLVNGRWVFFFFWLDQNIHCNCKEALFQLFCQKSVIQNLSNLPSKICDPKSLKKFRQKSMIQMFLIDPVSQLSSSPISQPCPMAGDSCASDCRAMSDCGTPCQIVSDVSSAKLCWSLNVERFQVLVDWYPMSDCVRSWSSKSQDGESFRLLVDSW